MTVAVTTNAAVAGAQNDAQRELTLAKQSCSRTRRNNPVHAITMGGIVRDAGLSVEEFKKLL
jgi:hypothetical protein